MELNENGVSIMLIFVGLILLICYISIWYFYNFTINRWEKTEGTIIKNGVSFIESSDSYNNKWKRRIVYTYKVGSKHYNSDRYTKNVTISYSDRNSIKNNKLYGVNRRVTVYYNPTKPHKAVIDKEFTYTNANFLFLGIILLAAGYYFWQ